MKNTATCPGETQGVGRRPGQRFLVIGSARLDLYRFGGDSLQGRYHLLRLHPLWPRSWACAGRTSFRTCCASAASRSRSARPASVRSRRSKSTTSSTGASFRWSAPRFENLVALHLLKWVHFEQDARGRDLELRYFRDTDGREVDFVVVEGREPVLLVEAKWGDTEADRSLRYLKARFPKAQAWQVSATGRKDFVTAEGIRVAPALELLGTLV